MRRFSGIAVVGLFLWACGGGAANRPKPETEEDGPRMAADKPAETGAEVDESVVSPDVEAKIRQVFSRREPKVAGCYSKRMEEKKLAEGEFLVKVQIRS